ncbi:MAG TPA: PEGA domain-containing protein [Vicinamibacteria bacterium]|nr:PEGA domain-containing protein [Vicinamibacteria bacterium]
MPILTEPEEDAGGGRRALVVLLAGLVVVAVGIALWFLARRPPEGPKGPPVAPRARTSPRPTPRAPAAEAKATPAPRAEARPEAPAPTLRVDADVPGANVFLDRRFLGRTPVETRAFEPGPHRLNVSADGYDMYAETIELSSAPREVVVRFKEVRLDERVDVVHKHGVGSCRGRLLATTAGLRYESEKAADSFEAAFATLEPLQVDYLGRTLRVKRRGGRTWNFTAESADALLAFQKAVEKARQRL